jgi:AAA domain/IclR helix-turn-helix domain
MSNVHDFPTRPKQPYRLNLVTAATLASTTFEEISFIVPKYIAPGLTVLAGRPKVGKSWMAANLAIAIATGGRALGVVDVEQGDVLYLALEDNARRLQRRLDQMIPFDLKPERLHFATECERLDKGGLQAIEAWCDSVPKPRCVVVDVFGRVRSERRRDESPYDHDYRSVMPLKALADRRNIAVVIIHHTNKRTDIDDPLDAVSSTTGFTGAADSILVLAKGPQGPTLYGRGRDIEEIETALQFDGARGLWKALGEASEVRRTDERKTILDALHEAEEALSPTEIADLTGMKPGNVRRLLGKMVKAGEVLKAGRARYLHPEHADDPNE